jgi:hypothetical protein
MDFLLNQRKSAVPSFESIATEGVGVHETLNTIAKLVMARFIEEHRMPVAGDVNVDQLAVKDA